VGAVESPAKQTRVQFGRIIRQLKHHWKLGVLLVPLLQLPAATPLGVEPAAAADEPAASAAAAGGGSEGGQRVEGQVQQQVDAVQGLLAAAAGFGLEDCWQWKPLLDGKQVRYQDVDCGLDLTKFQAKPLSVLAIPAEAACLWSPGVQQLFCRRQDGVCNEYGELFGKKTVQQV
jgi:hypothetical protein